MKLIVDNDVQQLPVRNLMDIPLMARGFADDLEAGDYGDVQRVIVVIDSSEGIRTLGWGDSTGTFEAIGILEAAKIVTFHGNFGEE